MTNLSPAAQAVLNAANGRSSYGPDDCLNESRWIAAAALRAAASTLLNHRYWHDGFWDKEPARFYQKKLLAIAAELEAQ